MAKINITDIRKARNVFRGITDASGAAIDDAQREAAKGLIANNAINDAYESAIASNSIVDSLFSGITAVKDAITTGDVSGAFSNQFLKEGTDKAGDAIKSVNFGRTAMGLSGAFLVGRAGLGAARGLTTDSSGNADIAGIPFI